MAEGEGIDVRPDSMEGLATALYLGMVSLDGLALTAPTLPNAGRSTPAVADALAGMADTLGKFTAAFGAAGDLVDASNATNISAEQEATRTFDVDPI